MCAHARMLMEREVSRVEGLVRVLPSRLGEVAAQLDVPTRSHLRYFLCRAPAQRGLRLLHKVVVITCNQRRYVVVALYCVADALGGVESSCPSTWPICRTIRSELHVAGF